MTNLEILKETINSVLADKSFRVPIDPESTANFGQALKEEFMEYFPDLAYKVGETDTAYVLEMFYEPSKKPLVLDFVKEECYGEYDDLDDSGLE